MPELTVELAHDIKEICRLVSAIDDFAHRHGVDRGVCCDVHVALDEIVSNVIFHAGPGETQRPIRVDVRLDDACLTVCVQDGGAPFNPLDRPVPDISKPLEERAIGGLGIFLVRELMDDLDYAWRNGTNVLTLTKRLTKD